MSEQTTGYLLQSLERALAVLDVIREQGPMGPTAIAGRLNLDKTTVYRILTTFSKHGWVQQDPENRRYGLGLRPIQYAHGVLSGLRIRNEARPFLEDLRDSTGATVNLGVVDDVRIVCADVVESNRSLRVQFAIGQVIQPHCTALGKAVIAYVPPQDLPAFVGSEPFPSFTENTITDLERLTHELELVRCRGFALDNLEFIEGARCAAAAIFDHRGCVIGGIAISMPTVYVTVAQLEEFSTQVVVAASAVSAHLGYQGER
jgi:DNA-binding IclR family transcriptional regulator